MLDDFIECFADILCELNFREMFLYVRKKISNPFLRGIFYLLSVLGGLSLAGGLAFAIAWIFSLLSG